MRRNSGMTDKEFKRLNRSQLIDIIYQLQVREEELVAANEKLSEELADKRILIKKAGNIAEASLEIHKVFQAVQEAAEHYREEMQIRAFDEHQLILKRANDKAAEIIEKAQQEAARIIEQAQMKEV